MAMEVNTKLTSYLYAKIQFSDQHFFFEQKCCVRWEGMKKMLGHSVHN